MSAEKLSSFTMHGTKGVSVRVADWPSWLHSLVGERVTPEDISKIYGKTSYYSWIVNDKEIRLYAENKAGDNWVELPDSSGFICFESGFFRDNCCIRDAFGNETMRLTVPYELTGYDVPEEASMWFINVCEHVDGEFGVSACVEYAGDFYFELDYHKGKFLWGKPIRI